MPFFLNIQQRLLGNVQYKISLIFCSIYVTLFYGKHLNPTIFFYLFISILLSIGIAGLGYIMNDWKDYADDIQNNKPNLFIKFSTTQSIVLTLIMIMLSIFPWWFLPFDHISIVLIVLEFGLFFIYAFPPFRLKEKGIFGIIADALYAQVIPCLLAVYTFSKIGNTTFSHWSLVIYAFWLLIVGIRNILKHQVDDWENDIRTNTKTFVTQHGTAMAEKISFYFVFPLEIILFFTLLFILDFVYNSIAILYILYLIYIYLNWKSNLSKYHTINARGFNEFYEIHLPILLLLYFSIYNTTFILVLLFHAFLFFSIYYNYIKGYIKKYIK